jgi:hypothetical protein
MGRLTGPTYSHECQTTLAATSDGPFRTPPPLTTCLSVLALLRQPSTLGPSHGFTRADSTSRIEHQLRPTTNSYLPIALSVEYVPPHLRRSDGANIGLLFDIPRPASGAVRGLRADVRAHVRAPICTKRQEFAIETRVNSAGFAPEPAGTGRVSRGRPLQLSAESEGFAPQIGIPGHGVKRSAWRDGSLTRCPQLPVSRDVDCSTSPGRIQWRTTAIQFDYVKRRASHTDLAVVVAPAIAVRIPEATQQSRPLLAQIQAVVTTRCHRYNFRFGSFIHRRPVAPSQPPAAGDKTGAVGD